MDKENASIKEDILIPNKVIILTILSIGLMIGLLGGTPAMVKSTLPVAFSFMILASIAWFLNRINSWITKYVLILGVTAALLLIINLSGIPQYIFLLAIIPIFSLSFAGKSMAITMGVIISILIFIFRWLGLFGLTQIVINIYLIVSWSSLILVLAIEQRIQVIIAWSWDRYQIAFASLDESRSHRGELVKMTEDLTHATHELSLMNEKLAQAKSIAEEAQRVKSAFVANVSHEFRTPLNMIIGLIDIIRENPKIYGVQLPSGILEDIEIVARNCDHLSTMVNDVLDLSQVEAGHLSLHKELIDLSEIVDKAIAVVKPLTDKKGLYIKIIIEPNFPAVYCDRNRIRQVLINFLGNAARFTQKGGITIDIRIDQGNAVVCIKDTGTGISSEDIDKLFQPFSQASFGSASPQSGSGLGLAISKEIIELSGGLVWVKSEPGTGSSFFFSLPVNLPGMPYAPPHSRMFEDWVWYERTEPVELNLALRNKRFLVCDYTGDFFPLINRYFDEFEFIELSDVDQAVKKYKGNPIQGILINVKSSDQLYQIHEQARAEFPDIPVIGFCFPQKIEHAIQAGAIGYLLKPINKTALQQSIQSLKKSPKSILLVDDHPDELILLRRMLNNFAGQLEIDTAISGQETLDKLHRRDYDLLFLDIILPDMDGWQVLRSKNEDPSIKDVPTIILSGVDPLGTPYTSPLILSGMNQGISFQKALDSFESLYTILLNSG